MTTSETLPEEIREKLDAFQNATHDWETAPQRGDTYRRDAAKDLLGARSALVAVILSYGRAERERGIGAAARVCGNLMLCGFPGPRQALAEAVRRVSALASPTPSIPDTDKENAP